MFGGFTREEDGNGGGFWILLVRKKKEEYLRHRDQSQNLVILK